MKPNLLTILTAVIISALFPTQAHTEQEPIQVYTYEYHISWDAVDNIGVKGFREVAEMADLLGRNACEEVEDRFR